MGGSGHRSGEKGWEVHRAWPVHDQDPREACDQGGQARDVRQDCGREGEAGEDHREGLRCGGSQEADLREWAKAWAGLVATFALTGRRSAPLRPPWVPRGPQLDLVTLSA